jgi:hypothetical protein
LTVRCQAIAANRPAIIATTVAVVVAIVPGR